MQNLKQTETDAARSMPAGEPVTFSAGSSETERQPTAAASLSAEPEEMRGAVGCGALQLASTDHRPADRRRAPSPVDAAGTWLTVAQAAELGVPRRTLKRWCRSGKVRTRKTRGNGGKLYQVLLSSLPEPLQRQYLAALCPQAAAPEPIDANTAAVLYSNASPKARETAAWRQEMVGHFGGLRGAELRAAIQEWNAQHPDQSTSFSRIMDWRKGYRFDGIAALLPEPRLPRASIVKDEWAETFRSLFLKQGAPGAMSCWKIVLGAAIAKDPTVTVNTFPSCAAFMRRLRLDVPTEAQYLARQGAKKWNRKYSPYISRNYSNVLAGQVYCADHAQIDIACALPDGSYGFPWVTAWRDFKSGKWVGWELRPKSPSSDPIFAAFYNAGTKYGIPSGILVDQGKDFRSRDLTGGRRRVRVEVDIELVRSLAAGLKIEVNFAQVYNAQTKPIERDFLNLKSWLSVHAIGYRGGNVVERPDSLNARIAAGQIEAFEELKSLFDTFVCEVINRSVVSTGHRAGKCPDEIFDAEAPIAAERGLLRTVTPDALKLFCSRTSNDMVIGRNGVRDSGFGVDYWGDFMAPLKGRKIYMRRDPQHHETAWIFDAGTNEYLGQGHLVQAIPALAQGPVEREQLGEAIRAKRRAQKAVRALARSEVDMSLREKAAHLAAATRGINDSRGFVPANYKPGDHSTAIITDMDRAVATEKRNSKRGKSGAIDRWQTIWSTMPDESGQSGIDPLAPYMDSAESAAS